MAAVRSTRDWPTEGIRVFVEDRKGGDELWDKEVLGVLHSKRVGHSRVCGGSCIKSLNGPTYAPNSPRSLRGRECR
jgi:hypothetical protein